VLCKNRSKNGGGNHQQLSRDSVIASLKDPLGQFFNDLNVLLQAIGRITPFPDSP
jgi:hypothetical protein